jgi:hypothetical protein
MVRSGKEARRARESVIPISAIKEKRMPVESSPHTNAARYAALREALFLQAHLRLHDLAASEPLRAARACLTARGFDLARLAQLPLGLVTDLAAMRASLVASGFSPDEVKAANLLADPRLVGRLLGPIRNAQGEIVSFWAWQTQGLSPKCLYLTRGWKQAAGLFGLDLALRGGAAGAEPLLVVEELLDAILLYDRGVRHVAAIGGSGLEMSEDRWTRLALLGISRVVLVLGEQTHTDRGMLAAVAASARAAASPEVLIVPPGGLGPARNWASLAGSNAIAMDMAGPSPRLASICDSLTAQIRHASMHGYRYTALAILERHRAGGPWTPASRQAALREAADFYMAAHPNHIPQLDAHFVPPFLEALPADEGCHAPWEKPEPEPVEIPPPVAIAPPPPVVAPPPPEPVLELPLPEPVAAPPAEAPLRRFLARPRRPATGPCELHRCDKMYCFCWD